MSGALEKLLSSIRSADVSQAREVLNGMDSDEIQAAASWRHPKSDESLLHLACRCGEVELLALLLQIGADANAKDKKGQTPLLVATRDFAEDMVRELLHCKAVDVNASDANGTTALMIASEHDYSELAEALLGAQGIDPNAVDQKGQTALMKAILADHDELAQSLLELSRRWLLNLADHEGRSAFMLACAAGQPMLAVVRDLLACPGVDVNQRDNKGRTALLVAASRDEREVLQLLLTTSGIDANLSDSTGNTALIAASRAGHTAIVEMLLGCNKKLDFNSRSGPQGYTALMWACEEGRADIVRLLTSRQQEIDANIASADGSTALMLASKSMFADCVKALLTWSKVDLLRKDQDGMTALDWARTRRRLESQRLLEEKLAK